MPTANLIHTNHQIDYNQNINSISNEANHVAFERNFANANFYLMSKKKEENEQSKNILDISNTGSSNEADEADLSVIEEEAENMKSNKNPKNKSMKEARISKIKANYLMQPPDSDSIAAATEQHKINRSRRRTRTKFDEKQVLF